MPAFFCTLNLLFLRLSILARVQAWIAIVLLLALLRKVSVGWESAFSNECHVQQVHQTSSPFHASTKDLCVAFRFPFLQHVCSWGGAIYATQELSQSFHIASGGFRSASRSCIIHGLLERVHHTTLQPFSLVLVIFYVSVLLSSTMSFFPKKLLSRTGRRTSTHLLSTTTKITKVIRNSPCR